ncbi:uncharacterized protein LOC128641310 isoform X1 [Bombina bombina]|uniref:uncharacterized protein LOC128641310 isoform X1 n=1 Tax=Bombina bombina TaxID=8345 RepID=UPI00235A5C9F|nr:uncharacterized protein LOC128641310 isoform X1 [Bombina bombina]
MNADNISASSLITITDLKECYICRDEDVLYREELCHYCDCKDLVVHQRCLLIWIQQGSGNEDRQRCKVCTAKFHLQEGSVWRALLCHWQNVLLLALLVGFMMLIPFIVHQIIILEDLSPDNLFRTAAACFGIIAEIFLVNYTFFIDIQWPNCQKLQPHIPQGNLLMINVGIFWPQHFKGLMLYQQYLGKKICPHYFQAWRNSDLRRPISGGT